MTFDKKKILYEINYAVNIKYLTIIVKNDIYV